MSRNFVAFVLVGGFAAAVNVAAGWLFHHVISYDVAIVLAYLVAMTTAFTLNRLLVFREAAGHAHHQFARFVLVNLLALAQVWGVSVLLARMVFPAVGFTWQAETVAHAIGVCSPIWTSYLAHKHFSFA